MKSCVHKLLLISCALYLSGAHWMLLQATAWTGMIVVRSQRVPVAEAVETTFDGQHPCRMCSAISEGQKEKNRSHSEFPALKALEEVKLVMMEVVTPPRCPACENAQWLEFVDLAVSRTDAPPTPPPRTV